MIILFLMRNKKISKIWNELEPEIKKFCKKNWKGEGDEVLQQALLVFLKNATAGKFEFRSHKATQAYLREIAKRVARDVIPRRHVSLDTLAAAGVELPFPSPSGEEDERIEFLRAKLEGKYLQVFNAVLAGEDIVAACRAAGVDYRTFVFHCRENWEMKDQLKLYV
jgi:DNA-directed RNA polymerase specialized sigma24 family protein